MLRKLNRITRDKDFKKIFKRSKKSETKNLSLRIQKRDEIPRQARDDNKTGSGFKLQATNYKLQNSPRFGFVVSNKVNKRATRRNALKRRLRAAVREIISSIDPNIDVIILVKKDFEFPYNFQTIKKQVEEGLKEMTNYK